MNAEKCLIPDCFIGKVLTKDVNEIKENQTKILEILSDNKMMLNEIKNLRRGIDELKHDNDKDHDLLFNRQQLKLAKADAKWLIGIGLTLSGIIFTIINLFLSRMMR